MTTEYKSLDGKATITDTHLIYEFGLLARVQRQSKRTDIPLDKITEIKIIPGTPSYLQVAVEGWTTSPVPNLSGLAFALDARKPHDAFIAALRSSTGIDSVRTTSAPTSAPRPTAMPSAKFGGYTQKNGQLSGGGKTYYTGGATAEATLGTPSRRSTVTRMGAGALLAGPVGFVVGAVVRKDTSKCYVTVELPDGVVVIEGRAKDYPDAVKFADAVNRSAG